MYYSFKIKFLDKDLNPKEETGLINGDTYSEATKRLSWDYGEGAIDSICLTYVSDNAVVLIKEEMLETIRKDNTI